MKFEKITDSKIKIVLSLKDMELNNVSAENIFSNSTSSQRLLQNMLNRAEQEIGFKTNDSKLLVEAVMSSEDECVFIITKISENNPTSKEINCSFIFKFDCFDDFVDLCSFLNNLSDLNLKEFSKNFSLVLYNDTYYLYNLDIETYFILLDYMKNVFSEFGTNVSNSTGIDGILNEYGKKIFENNAIIKCIFNFI